MASFDPSPEVYYRCGNRGCHQIIPPKHWGWCWTCMEMGTRLTRKTQTECGCGCQVPEGVAREEASGLVSHYTYHEDDKTVGEFQVHLLGQVALLCGLEVYPQYRGRGCGKRALDAQVAEALKATNVIRMVVKHSNRVMLHLATDAGFRIIVDDRSTEEYKLERGR